MGGGAKSKLKEPTNRGFWVSSGNRNQLVIDKWPQAGPYSAPPVQRAHPTSRGACCQLALRLEGMGKER